MLFLLKALHSIYTVNFLLSSFLQNGVTPLDVARVHGREELCQALSSATPTPCPPPPKEEETLPAPQTTPQDTQTTPPPSLASLSEASEQSKPHTTPTEQEGRNRPFEVSLFPFFNIIISYTVCILHSLHLLYLCQVVCSLECLNLIILWIMYIACIIMCLSH